MARPKGYVDTEYLQVVGEFLNHLKQRTYTCMGIETGHKVLDVGCGPGIDTIALSELVDTNGEVYGVDYDQEMVAEAERRAEEAGISAWVKHKHSDAAALPFETGYFDSCRSERLFQHLPEPTKALADMVRVTKANGWVVILDTDLGSFGTDTREVEIERRLVRFLADHLAHNGYSGRQLYRQFKKQGLVNVSFEVFPLVMTNYAFARQAALMDKTAKEALAKNVITEAELKRYQMDLEQADADGVYFSYGCMMLVAGQKAG
ncbi:MAG TPA: methyltransferase domain-containing protein [Anaerolineales bacterium]|jgi:ubiquinone/menaquinone biosynthesis C-methylase UbiE|nr:methyltransferase domain-containing protein [Anaerolineales bacterium]